MIKVGTLPDGRLIGEQDGALYYGTKRQATYDEINLKAVDGKLWMTYGDQMLGCGDIGTAPDSDGPMPKQYQQVVVIEDGVERFESRELTKQVVDWEAA